MSALPSHSAMAASLAGSQSKTRGFLHIARHGTGPGAMYVMTYHQLNHDGEAPRPKPVLAEGAQSLIELLEQIGVDFRLGEVRDALADILRLGSANIPDLWLSEDEVLRRGLAGS